MGYTHYWSFKKQKRVTKKLAKQYADAILECQRIVRAYSVANGGLAGFAAHTEPGKYGGLKVNGSRENAHEDFIMLDTVQAAINNGGDFCKTNRKPYDVVVVACLCVLQSRLGDAITVSSDGDSVEWVRGLELARRVLGDKTLKLPERIRVRLAVI